MSINKEYQVFEGLRIATALTFISGYLNAFTYVTQGGRFAGIQSGNIIMLSYYLAKGEISQVLSFLNPIFFFILGQFIVYLLKRKLKKDRWTWHFCSSLLMTVFIILAVMISPFVGPFFTMATLAFVASIQIGTFQKLRGAPYANVMMTGNLKNAAYLWFKGWMEHDKILRKRGQETILILGSFSLGVIISTLLSLRFFEYGLVYVLIPALYVNYELWREKSLA
ncbi:YoaK family protein [Streptococcus respiraculi]|uniref:YoaK family protein n=1 Tax=Streptococcus respiraculi TaxID=2021971 RepID=UPI000E738B9A|nr:YoaK family protein [Streptococcus respiraculi]